MISDLDRARIKAAHITRRRRPTKWGAEVIAYDSDTGRTFARLDSTSDARQVQPLGSGPFTPGQRIMVDMAGPAGGFVPSDGSTSTDLATHEALTTTAHGGPYVIEPGSAVAGDGLLAASGSLRTWAPADVPLGFASTITAGVTDQALGYSGIGVAPFLATRPGCIVGLSATVSVARSAGTMDLWVFKNLTKITDTAIQINGTDTTGDWVTVAFNAQTFVAGDVLNVAYTTSGTFAPTALNSVSASAFVVFT